MTSVAVETVLVGDLGGTHARFGLYGDSAVRGTAVSRWSDVPQVRTALEAFLDGRPVPRAGCLAVAAPVEGSQVRLTNAQVDFCAEELRSELGMERLLVVNDVQALARSVAMLQDDDAAELGAGPLRRDHPVVVVAPGTGLGVAALLPTRPRPVVVAGEGGQIPLPATTLGLPVAQVLLERHGHVSAEDLVCGSGLPVLDAVVRALVGEDQPTARTAAEITASGDPVVLDVFVDLLAAVVQSHVLTFGAWGGVVLGGGFLRDLVPLLRVSGFRSRFAEHPKMQARLEAVPVIVDTRDNPALVGAALLLEDH